MTKVFRKLPLSCWILLLWGIFCLIWTIAAVKPWDTQAFATELSSKRTPVEDFRSAGLWIGFAMCVPLCAILLLARRWWAGPEPSPVLPPHGPQETLPRRWFFLALLALLVFATWQRWPAMRLSFWGDEGMMFCDFVHGKWQPAIKGGSLQDKIKFIPVTWNQAVFSDFSGANHWLSTDLQRLALKTWQALAHQPIWAFEEWVVRLVPLSAGLASLVALAAWLRWMGRPVTGLVAAMAMALHPSHVRFSVEARGYSLMLLFFILTLWAISKALQQGRKRDWLWVGVAQFLMLYSWKGGVYALVFVNLVLAARLLLGKMPDISQRKTALARWLLAGFAGAMLFVPLTVSSQLQIRKSIDEVRRRAKPMEMEWRHNLISETLTGIPWHEAELENPREVTIGRLQRQTGWTLPLLAVLGGVMLLGQVRLWRQDRFLWWQSLAVLGSGLAAAFHFKYSLRVELLTWYLLYQLPILALIFAFAVTPPPGILKSSRTVPAWATAGALALSLWALLTLPMIQDFQQHPRENFKEAVRLTRGAHEAPGFSGPSNIYTAWLWRHTYAYEPRADMYVRTQEALDAKRALARRSGGEFYMIVGIRDLSEAVCPEVMKALRDPQQFDKITTLWGVETLNTLEVYRMKKPPQATAPGPSGK